MQGERPFQLIRRTARALRVGLRLPLLRVELGRVAKLLELDEEVAKVLLEGGLCKQEQEQSKQQTSREGGEREKCGEGSSPQDTYLIPAVLKHRLYDRCELRLC